MKIGLRLAAVLAVVPLWTACATKLSVSSSPPGALVFESDTKLGATPLEISSDSVKTPVSGGYLLRLERDGYHRVWVWVPNGIRGLNLVVNMQPFAVTDAPTGRDMARVEMDSVSARILDIQKDLLLKGAVQDDVLGAVMSEHPDIGAMHYLAALNFLRKGSTEEAKTEAGKALALSPAEPDYVVLYRELGGDPGRATPVGAESPAVTGAAAKEGGAAP